jgi:branched-subunit amino acid ABC-type transport system permease component
MPFWWAFVLALGVMVGLGVSTERVVLRPLVNQPQITLFMATIGLTFFSKAWHRWSGARAHTAGSRHSRRADRRD